MRTAIHFGLLLLLLGTLPSSATTINNSIETLEAELQLKILHDSVVEDSWDALTYNLPADSAFLMQYLDWLGREYRKYPEGYFQRAGVTTVVLCTDLHYAGQNRAAVPDAYRSVLYLAVDGAYDDSTETYLVHVMHHELHHCSEYALWKNMSYHWKKWNKTNRCLFRYKGAGSEAYKDLSISWYAMVHPLKGFVNLYSTTAQEEDRSEIVALIMSDIEREFLFTYAPGDKKLTKKIQLAMDVLDRINQGSGSHYWNTVMEGRIVKKKS